MMMNTPPRLSSSAEFPTLGSNASRPAAAPVVQRRGQSFASQTSASQGGIDLREDFPALPGATAPRPAGADRGNSLHAGPLPGDGRQGAGAQSSTSRPGSSSAAPPEFGMLGLVDIMQTQLHDKRMLAHGMDLMSLGLALDSPESLYTTFGSPFSAEQAADDPSFTLPECYNIQTPPLSRSHFDKYEVETLFYIFYGMPQDVAQSYAAQELYQRNWWYHPTSQQWFTRAAAVELDESKATGGLALWNVSAWTPRLYTGKPIPDSAFLPASELRDPAPTSS